MKAKETVGLIPQRCEQAPVKVVAVTGGKGGVGKSSISTNVALALATTGRRVMLLDGDLGLANLHLLLGVKPRFTLRNVIRGECSLADAICDGPAGMQLLAGANGFSDMARLAATEHAGIINCFSEYEEELDFLIVDTAPGISDSVLQFGGASNHCVVVVRDEPASITDAYAIIKLLSTEKDIRNFEVVTNMTSVEGGARVYEHLRSIAERFLAVSVSHAGNIPADERLARAVRCQRPVITAFPRSSASKSIQRLAQRIDAWPSPRLVSGRLEFFVDRLISAYGSVGPRREAVW